MTTVADEAREARLSRLLQAWRVAYRRMRERQDPEAEKLQRDIERLQAWASERPVEEKSR